MEIHYAKTARKMDMRKLKQSMWRLLAELPTAAGEVRAQATGSTSPPAPAWGAGRLPCPWLLDPER